MAKNRNPHANETFEPDDDDTRQDDNGDRDNEDSGDALVESPQKKSTALAAPTRTEIDEFLGASDMVAKRTFRTSYPLETNEGKVKCYRHRTAKCETIDGDKWLNKEFLLVAFTSYMVKKNDEQTGEVFKLLRTVIETSTGKMIESYSSYVFQSLNEIADLRGYPDFSKTPLRCCIEKRGRSHAICDMDLLEGKGQFAVGKKS